MPGARVRGSLTGARGTLWWAGSRADGIVETSANRPLRAESQTMTNPSTTHAMPPVPPTWRADAMLHLLMGRREAHRMASIRADVAAHPALAGHRLVWHVPDHGRHTPAVAEDAAKAARAEQGLLLAIGGDGTINAAAQACLRHGVPMGVVCQGTFNYFSRQHGIAADLGEAIEQFTQALAQGLVRPVRPGVVNGQAFLVNASLGLYPRLLADREVATRHFGRHQLVAMVAGLLSLLRVQRGQMLRLRERDDHGHERQRMTMASTLFVGTNALQLQRVGLQDAQQTEQQADGTLLVATLAPRHAWSMLVLMWQAARGRLARHEAVDSFSCTALTVEAAGWRLTQRVRVAFDGERTWMTLPLRFALAERPLWLVAPPAHVGQVAQAAQMPQYAPLVAAALPSGAGHRSAAAGSHPLQT